MNASTPASFSAAARVDWRERNSERGIGQTSSNETWSLREDQAQDSRFSDENDAVEWIENQCVPNPARRIRSMTPRMIRVIRHGVKTVSLERRLDFDEMRDSRGSISFSEGENIVKGI